MGGEEGEGEMYGESNIEIYNTMCKTDSQWEFAVRLGELKQGTLWQAEGLGGKGDGREVWEEGDMGIPMADSCWCMTENHKILLSNYPSIKKFFFNFFFFGHMHSMWDLSSPTTDWTDIPCIGSTES